MSTFQVIPSDMSTASNAVIDAAARARGRGSSADLATAATAVPGASSVEFLSELGAGWDEDVESWATSVDSFGTRIAATSNDTQRTDGQVGGLFGGLLGLGGR